MMNSDKGRALNNCNKEACPRRNGKCRFPKELDNRKNHPDRSYVGKKTMMPLTWIPEFMD